jgi:poly(A) polymerase
VADAIRSLVPNIEVFKMALRLLKMWCANRGLYSNKMGYFGGVQLAICTARICQLWPCAAPSAIVHCFFQVFKEEGVWNNPVRLNEVERKADPGKEHDEWKELDEQVYKTPEEQELSAALYGGRQARRQPPALMPVLTPAYPAMLATFNVHPSTKRILLQVVSCMNVDGRSSMRQI